MKSEEVSIQTMVLPVSVLFSVFSILFFVSKRGQRVKSLLFPLLLIWLALALIATFRPEDMPDMENYLWFWNGWGGERFEIGFATITDALQRITTNKYWFLFVFAALSIALKITAICRISPLIWASLLIYIANVFILHDMIQMRAAVASGLLLHAVYYLGNRDSKRFLITSGIAFLFHYSSLIILPLWFLNTKRSYKYFYIGLIALAYIVGGVLPVANWMQHLPLEGLQNLWAMYENREGEVNIFNTVQLGRTAICVFLLLFIDKVSAYNKYAVLIVKIYAISIAVLVLFSSVPVIAFRVSELYQVVEIALIPMVVYAVRDNVLLKRIAVFAIGLAFLLMNVFYLEYLK